MGILQAAPVVEPIELANEPEFDIGAMRVKPAERAVVVHGHRRELQPRVMQVLVALAQARPSVVSRDKLVEQCWDGRVVGDDALNRVILSLRHLAKEFTPQPFAIETVPRVGHRLVEAGAMTEAAAARSSRRRSWRVPVIIIVALFAAAVGLLLWQQRSAQYEPASIAVLPFRNLSNGDPYFAEGVGEEILNQLAREPAFRVVGRASAARFAGEIDPREVGQKLGVQYLLEGSVRSDAGRVRVHASLLRTKDGTRLWSETYDRGLDDILEIQSAIGQAVANGLSRKLVHAPRSRLPRGEAYALYLNARGLLRTGNPESGPDALRLLQESLRIDPQFARAWSSVAEAMYLDARTKDREALIAAWPKAVATARRALQLDPSLAEAHGMLATLFGSDTPEAVDHLRRAADLAPRSAEGLLLQSIALDGTGEFEESLAALHRARALDPLWPGPVYSIIDLTASLGDRVAAELAVRRGFPDDAALQEHALARVAWFFGDYSDAARRWSAVSNGQSRWASPARLSVEDVRYTLQLSQQLPSRPTRPYLGSQRFSPRPWMTKPPSAAEWQRRNRSTAAALVYHDENIVAAKLMLNAGRAGELVATYDSPSGLLSIPRGSRIAKCQLHEVPVVALALRTVGRGAEADALLRQSDALIRRVYGGSKVPTWFDDDAAAVWAVQGKADQAVAALNRALRRRWVHGGRTDLPNLEDEPAFRSLRNDRRFRILVSRHKAHLAKERQETAQVLRLRA